MKENLMCRFEAFIQFSLTSLLLFDRQMNNVGSMLIKEDEDLMSGYINVTIHSGQGFLRACSKTINVVTTACAVRLSFNGL